MLFVQPTLTISLRISHDFQLNRAKFSITHRHIWKTLTFIVRNPYSWLARNYPFSRAIGKTIKLLCVRSNGENRIFKGAKVLRSNMHHLLHRRYDERDRNNFCMHINRASKTSIAEVPYQNIPKRKIFAIDCWQFVHLHQPFSNSYTQFVCISTLLNINVYIK